MSQEARENLDHPKIKSFTDLIAWQEAHKFALAIYKVTKNFPKEESFGLTIQLRRAVVSITSNLAEGFSRGTLKDKANFYCIALGSTTEVQNQILMARDLHYIIPLEFQNIAEQSVKVNKLINGLIKKTRSFIS
jgi:four helix bundle protein